jgi:hypothetical protein
MLPEAPIAGESHSFSAGYTGVKRASQARRRHDPASRAPGAILVYAAAGATGSRTKNRLPDPGADSTQT